MQGDALKKRLKNMALFAGVPLSPEYTPDRPSPYLGRRKQYFAALTQDFVWDKAQYASNYFAAQVQGCIPGPFEKIRGANLRSMDIVEQSTGTQLPNEWQLVYFQDPRIEGLYTGAKLWYGGNTWLATAPSNIASATGNAVVRRCNAIWNHLDYYGNVKTEPFVWNKPNANATANEYLDYNVMEHNYQRCVMQLNDDTRDILQNRRMVLGSSAYEVSSVVDFVCDFSDMRDEAGDIQQRQDSKTCHIIYFDLYYTEPLEIDDMEREIAGGKAFSWVLQSGAPLKVRAGGTMDMRISSLRNGVQTEGTEEHPISYLYHSSDESVATVDADGTVTGVSEGEATITVTLEQNTGITEAFTVTVEAAAQGGDIILAPELPAALGAMESAETRVFYAEDGTETAGAVTMTASGPEAYCYSAEMDDSGNLTVTCYAGSVEPLVLTFNCNGVTERREIRLKGI